MQATIATPTTVQPAPVNSQAPRQGMFIPIHKGLRRYMADALVAVGCTDHEDAESVAATVASVRGLVELCRVHLHAENQFIHPAMEARRPGSSRSTADEHVGHEAAFETLIADVQAVERSAGRNRATALAVLYQRLALFVADNFEHMFEEETHNQSVLWEAYTDDELRAIEAAIVASHTPEVSAVALKWMLPALSPSERVALLSGAREGMPREAFEGLLSFGVSLLSERDGLKLRAAFCSGPHERKGWPA